jgi:hypothetical protein
MSRGGRNIIDLAGRKFYRWSVVSRAGSSQRGRTLWLCRCECGVERKVEAMNLLQHKSKSCGCLRSEPFAMKHGFSRGPSRTRVYRAWRQMKSRCDNPAESNYKYYGGRGISYEPRWSAFVNFLTDMGETPNGAWLDRIDNSKGYSKENCRWTDPVTQRRNRSDPLHWVEIKGERLILTDAVKKYGKVTYLATLMRIGRGWSQVDALLTPKGDRPA